MKSKAESVLAGKRIRVHVLGCRSNLYEAEAISSALSQKGAVPCEGGAFDGAIVVSCVVTAEAERKCRQLVRRLKREEPAAPVVVCGCWAQLLDEKKAREMGINAIVGNRRKHRVAAVVEKLFEERVPPVLFTDRADISASPSWDNLLLESAKFHVRAFVKVQDGCDHHCTYCIIPSVRGASVSRNPREVLSEIRNLASHGIREVVLTGIHLGLYGKNNGFSLVKLVKAVEGVDGIDRIRFGSIEPFGLDEKLLEGLAESDKFCPHLHIPLQSGDDEILRRMGRGYRGRDFIALSKKARKILGEDLHISTDVIVGFPGEDKNAFLRTMDVLESAGVGRIHAFPFSPRQGTPAAEFPERPDPGKVKERMKEILDFAAASQHRYASPFVGKNLPILVEKCESGFVSGYTPHYVRVNAEGSFSVNGVAEVAMTNCRAGILHGRVCYNAHSGSAGEIRVEKE